MNSFFTSRRMIRLGQLGLLALLTMALCGPAPSVFREGSTVPTGAAREDSAPEDAPPSDPETSEESNFAEGLLVRRYVQASRVEAPSVLLPLRPAALRAPTLAEPPPPPGHFLADGRALRLHLRSLTC
ncbi:hypothetical protein P12x_005182 [Tundrisphaera lichenicola]|uniref:hypothetical protein n=1 Tax=Tundrisphaera lichenicola TaxID=2029860 RepID=UPI003EB99595